MAIGAFNHQLPVGRFERIPIRMLVDGQTRTADLMQGLTLAPEFRQWTHLRQMLVAGLSAEALEWTTFSFGFTTAAASKLHATLGGPVLGRVHVFAALLDGATLFRSRKFPPLLNAITGVAVGALLQWRPSSPDDSIEVVEVSEFGRLDELRSASNGGRTVFVRKDTLYLNWRYVERPGAIYRRLFALRSGRPAGFLVWRADEINRDGHILELIARDGDLAVLDALLHFAREQMRAAGVGLVMASFPGDSPSGRALRRARFVNWMTFWKNMHLIVTPGQCHEQPELYAPAWDYALGDWLYH